MSITYNTNIPQPGDVPSISQGQFLTNFNAIQAIWGIDHINFNVGAGSVSGEHKFVTFNGKNTPAAQSGDNSALYTVSGTASTSADMRFKNPNGIFPVNVIRAYASCDGGGGLLNSINVTSVTKNTGGGNIIYEVQLVANVVNSTTFGVLITPLVNALNPQVAGSFNRTGPATFNINFRNNSNVQLSPDGFTFIVLEI